MMVVIADDFSGASEIAGIGWRYGLSSEVQINFNSKTNAELVIVDADTRSTTKEQAAKKTDSLLKELKNCGNQVQLFKKVDSVLRGHIVEEINVLQEYFNYKRVLLLPANPARGRKIISGHYYVNDQSLEKTVFACDPHFPTASSSIEKIIAHNKTALPHVHLARGSKLSGSALITGDVAKKEDIKDYIKQTDDADLCCGAAECFEAYLENKGYVAKQNKRTDEPGLQWSPYTLIISGSTVKDQFEKDETKQHRFPTVFLPGKWNGDQFVLEKETEEDWQIEVLGLLQKHKLTAIAINHEVKKIDGAGFFGTYFIRLIHFVSEKLGKENIHFALTGGATASEIIKKEGSLNLKVKKEITSGVVTLINEKSKQLFTVKPGSYLWPAVFIESLLNKNKFN